MVPTDRLVALNMLGSSASSRRPLILRPQKKSPSAIVPPRVSSKRPIAHAVAVRHWGVHWSAVIGCARVSVLVSVVVDNLQLPPGRPHQPSHVPGPHSPHTCSTHAIAWCFMSPVLHSIALSNCVIRTAALLLLRRGPWAAIVDSREEDLTETL